jgi:hypothetical protein
VLLEPSHGRALDGERAISREQKAYMVLDFFFSDNPGTPGNSLFGGMG